ncbi:BREX-3 system P-loop-containing protein BrxF [Acetonema longum]|uniref:ATPase dynein-related AAA domain-containing protein n=1 Tax=Acetonema longum DSM 6540 TaxID=1009370 RepID=F7NMY7_9FIRM|nr:BREX-3 system P-loop-containing protein BrxF [Acetonema longum]EGO62598.1 hypothetical protein ALO_17351 [Acetonema longum DSM 6540]
MPVTVQRVVETIREVEQGIEKLLLLVGGPGSGKSKVMRELAALQGWEYLDCRELMTEELLELVPKARAQEAPAIAGRVLGAKQAEVILLDGIQVLFAPVMHLEPLDLLRQLSQKFCIIAAWPGEVAGGKLVLAQTGRATPREYPLDRIRTIELD